MKCHEMDSATLKNHKEPDFCVLAQKSSNMRDMKVDVMTDSTECIA